MDSVLSFYDGLEGTVACARCGAAHGTSAMRLGRRELVLNAAAVAAVQRTPWGTIGLACRTCGHVTPHHAVTVRTARVDASGGGQHGYPARA
jgi:hypothetical protein